MGGSRYVPDNFGSGWSKTGDAVHSPVKPFNVFPPGSDYRLAPCRKFMVGAGEYRRYRFKTVRLGGRHE